MQTETRPGPRTTEFWITVVVLVSGFLQQIAGIVNISDSRVLGAQALVSAIYVISRGLAKAGTPNREVVIDDTHV